jgi:hypothetical protein
MSSLCYIQPSSFSFSVFSIRDRFVSLLTITVVIQQVNTEIFKFIAMIGRSVEDEEVVF